MPKEIICTCMDTTKEEIQQKITEKNAEDIWAIFGDVIGGCGSCYSTVTTMLKK